MNLKSNDYFENKLKNLFLYPVIPFRYFIFTNINLIYSEKLSFFTRFVTAECTFDDAETFNLRIPQTEKINLTKGSFRL